MPGPWEEPATLADALACYRLLLGRQADPDGLAHYHYRLDDGSLTVGELVAEFVGSVEFARSHGLARGRGPRPSEVVATSEGFKIHVDPTDYAVGHTIARDGTYEPDVTLAVRGLLHEGATFVDAGANIGWFTMLAASLVGPSGMVVGIEPNPANTELARKSVADNGFGNVELATVALSDRAGAVALETDGSNGRVVLVDGPPAGPVVASYVVASCTLDSLLAGYGVSRVDVMKMDVEGAEPLVLAGAAGILGRDRPVLVSEFYPLALDSSPWGSATGYLAQLRALGYRLSVIGHEVPEDWHDEQILSLASSGKGQLDLLCRPG